MHNTWLTFNISILSLFQTEREGLLRLNFMQAGANGRRLFGSRDHNTYAIPTGRGLQAMRKLMHVGDYYWSLFVAHALCSLTRIIYTFDPLDYFDSPSRFTYQGSHHLQPFKLFQETFCLTVWLVRHCGTFQISGWLTEYDCILLSKQVNWARKLPLFSSFQFVCYEKTVKTPTWN